MSLAFSLVGYSFVTHAGLVVDVVVQCRDTHYECCSLLNALPATHVTRSVVIMARASGWRWWISLSIQLPTLGVSSESTSSALEWLLSLWSRIRSKFRFFPRKRTVIGIGIIINGSRHRLLLIIPRTEVESSCPVVGDRW